MYFFFLTLGEWSIFFKSSFSSSLCYLNLFLLFVYISLVPALQAYLFPYSFLPLFLGYMDVDVYISTYSYFLSHPSTVPYNISLFVFHRLYFFVFFIYWSLYSHILSSLTSFATYNTCLHLPWPSAFLQYIHFSRPVYSFECP